MSTNNFKFENILIVIPDFNIYEDGEWVDYDTFAYDEWVDGVRDELNKIGFEDCDKSDNDRSYCGHIIAKCGLTDKTGMIVWVEVVIRSGYYDGANIDYTIDGDFDVIEGNKKSESHYHAMHRKLDRLVEKTRKILLKNGTEYLKVGQFSNGEAVYKKK